MLDRQLPFAMSTLRTDNGGEFVNAQLRDYLELLGIRTEFNQPHTSHQNGGNERSHRTTIEMARTMLNSVKMPKEFWEDAFRYAVYILNRVPNRVRVDGKTPF